MHVPDPDVVAERIADGEIAPVGLLHDLLGEVGAGLLQSRKGTVHVVGVECHLRNALIPIITVVGLQTGLLLGGAVLTESIFAWPGVGRLAYEAISNRDSPLINGSILLFAATFVVVNLIVDLLYAAFNPRIRYA